MSDEEDILSRATQRIGAVLHGKYRLDGVLGVGGMAIVYAATHRNQKQFAVKVLHPEFAVRSDFRARFLREGYAANSVGHPGVVAVLDDDVDDFGTAFLVMELLRGADVELLRARSGGQLPVQLALVVAHQVLGVLEAAHAKGLVHRDLKPANFFVVEGGSVKVLDFGIARLREASSNIQSTRSGAVLGTPAFMAPEQASARGSDIDTRTDLWAVGASLFTMLSGQFVHDAENGSQTLIQAATLPARSLASSAPGLPTALVALVDQAVMFDPAARFQSASAMRDALDQVHRQLFGELSLEPLRASLEGFAAPRYLNGSSPVSSRSSRATSALGESETTAAMPSSVGAEREPRRPATRGRGRRRETMIVALLAALLGTSVLTRAVLAPSSRPAQLSTSRSVAQAAVPRALPSGPVANAEAVLVPPPALVTKAAASAQPRTRASRPKAALSTLALNAARPSTASGNVAPAAPSTAAPEVLAAGNPLELKLQ